MSALILPAGGDDGYQIQRSVRFRNSASAYLGRTSVTPTSGTTWTWSGWVKRGLMTSNYYSLFGGGTNATTIYDGLYFVTSTDSLNFFLANGANLNLITTQVFRDPSAWYHVVAVLDTTQATAANRAKIYVNGVQITAFSTATYPAQNTVSAGVNASNIPQVIGAVRTSSVSLPFDGYLSEINFIDGQALTPSSFGETDTITGMWKPKKYTGTYGTNGFYLPFSLQSQSSYAGSFNGSTQYLALNGQSAFTLGTNSFTIEGWFYLNSASQTTMLYDGRPLGVQGAYPTLYFNAGTLTYLANSAAIVTGGAPAINQWHHVAVVRNGTTVTMYLNGVRTASATDTTNYLGGGTSRPLIGTNGNASGNFFNGSISNFRVVNGSAVYTANFIPPAGPLTAITNTALLTLQGATIVDNSSNAFAITNGGTVATSVATPFAQPDLGADYSGNANNWTTNNISVTPGVTYDSMLDVPTLNNGSSANFCTLNPLMPWGSTVVATLTEGNTKLTSTSGAGARAFGQIGMTSGKWYWEAQWTAGASPNMSSGVTKDPISLVELIGFDANSWGYYVQPSNIGIWNNGSRTAVGVGFSATTDVLGVAFDADVGSLYFYKNGTLIGSGALATGLTGATFYPAISANGSTSVINFGQRPFTYTPPSGFKALNTFNLPDPLIQKSNMHFDTLLWTSTASIKNITGASFRPDLVWVKDRSTASANEGYHHFVDSVRGTGKVLSSNVTSGEYWSGTNNSVTAFNSDGFASGTFDGLNNSLMVSWLWKGGGSAVSNTSGSITSQVSANPTAGFSIVTYTGTGANATVGHGLSVSTPSLIIVKDRDSGTNGGAVYHKSRGATKYMKLFQTTNGTDGEVVDNTVWNGSSPTINSTVFSVGTSARTNTSLDKYVAYVFAEVPGFSKIDSYLSNGATDGTFVYTGFRPRFIMIKQPDVVRGWILFDTARNTSNVVDKYLFAETAAGEGATNLIDITSNGFKHRSTNVNTNTTANSNYIYMAFAENPFKYSLAR